MTIYGSGFGSDPYACYVNFGGVGTNVGPINGNDTILRVLVPSLSFEAASGPITVGNHAGTVTSVQSFTFLGLTGKRGPGPNCIRGLDGNPDPPWSNLYCRSLTEGFTTGYQDERRLRWTYNITGTVDFHEVAGNWIADSGLYGACSHLTLAGAGGVPLFLVRCGLDYNPAKIASFDSVLGQAKEDWFVVDNTPHVSWHALASLMGVVNGHPANLDLPGVGPSGNMTAFNLSAANHVTYQIEAVYSIQFGQDQAGLYNLWQPPQRTVPYGTRRMFEILESEALGQAPNPYGPPRRGLVWWEMLPPGMAVQQKAYLKVTATLNLIGGGTGIVVYGWIPGDGGPESPILSAVGFIRIPDPKAAPSNNGPFYDSGLIPLLYTGDLDISTPGTLPPPGEYPDRIYNPMPWGPGYSLNCHSAALNTTVLTTGNLQQMELVYSNTPPAGWQAYFTAGIPETIAYADGTVDYTNGAQATSTGANVVVANLRHSPPRYARVVARMRKWKDRWQDPLTLHLSQLAPRYTILDGAPLGDLPYVEDIVGGNPVQGMSRTIKLQNYSYTDPTKPAITDTLILYQRLNQFGMLVASVKTSPATDLVLDRDDTDIFSLGFRYKAATIAQAATQTVWDGVVQAGWFAFHGALSFSGSVVQIVGTSASAYLRKVFQATDPGTFLLGMTGDYVQDWSGMATLSFDVQTVQDGQPLTVQVDPNITPGDHAKKWDVKSGTGGSWTTITIDLLFPDNAPDLVVADNPDGVDVLQSRFPVYADGSLPPYQGSFGSGAASGVYLAVQLSFKDLATGETYQFRNIKLTRSTHPQLAMLSARMVSMFEDNLPVGMGGKLSLRQFPTQLMAFTDGRMSLEEPFAAPQTSVLNSYGFIAQFSLPVNAKGYVLIRDLIADIQARPSWQVTFPTRETDGFGLEENQEDGFHNNDLEAVYLGGGGTTCSSLFTSYPVVPYSTGWTNLGIPAPGFDGVGEYIDTDVPDAGFPLWIQSLLWGTDWFPFDQWPGQFGADLDPGEVAPYGNIKYGCLVFALEKFLRGSGRGVVFKDGKRDTGELVTVSDLGLALPGGTGISGANGEWKDGAPYVIATNKLILPNTDSLSRIEVATQDSQTTLPWYPRRWNIASFPGGLKSNPGNFHSSDGRYHEFFIHAGNVVYRNSIIPTPSAGWDVNNVHVSTSGLAHDPQLEEGPYRRLIMVWGEPDGGWTAYSDNSGVTWSTPTMAIPGGKHLQIRVIDEGDILRAAVVGTGIQGTLERSGEAESAPFQFKDRATGLALQVVNDSFGLSQGRDSSRRVLLHVTIAGESSTSSWEAWGDLTQWARQ